MILPGAGKRRGVGDQLGFGLLGVLEAGLRPWGSLYSFSWISWPVALATSSVVMTLIVWPNDQLCPSRSRQVKERSP